MQQPNHYVWNARDYAKNSQNQSNWAKELMAKLNLRGNEAVLDIGCGDGKISAEISRALSAGRVVGVDSSKGMINLAECTYPKQQHPNLRFLLMDAQKLSFNGEFDVAFSNAALHWILNQKSVLAGVHRSLKPGGRLLFQMAGKGNAQAILDVLDEMLPAQRWRQYFEGFTFPYAFLSPQEYRALLLEAELEPLRVELLPKKMIFGDVEGLAGWIRTTWLPFTQRLPLELRGCFVDEVIQRYLKRWPVDDSGSVHLSMVRLEVEAVKPP